MRCQDPTELPGRGQKTCPDVGVPRISVVKRMSQEDKTGQKGNIERDKHHLLQTRRSSCMDFSTQYLMILGFEGCTPIYNNHATTAFSMVLTPSRLVHRITRLIFVSYAAEVVKE